MCFTSWYMSDKICLTAVWMWLQVNTNKQWYDTGSLFRCKEFLSKIFKPPAIFLTCLIFEKSVLWLQVWISLFFLLFILYSPLCVTGLLCALRAGVCGWGGCWWGPRLPHGGTYVPATLLTVSSWNMVQFFLKLFIYFLILMYIVGTYCTCNTRSFSCEYKKERTKLFG